MSQIEFHYYAIYRTEERTPPAVGLICSEDTSGPPRTVLWSHPRREWRFNRDVGASYLYDDEIQPRRGPVSRAEAERIAREVFATELPSEEELHRICEEGEAALESR